MRFLPDSPVSFLFGAVYGDHLPYMEDDLLAALTAKIPYLVALINQL